MFRLLPLVALLCVLNGCGVPIHEPDMGRRVPAPQPGTIDETAAGGDPRAAMSH